MFYSAELLSIRSSSGLGIVWYATQSPSMITAIPRRFRLAATLGPRSQTRRLSRRDYASVDIVDSCKYVMAPPEPLSLRLASSLMIGIARVYGQQCQIYFADAQQFWSSLASLRGGQGGPVAKRSAGQAAVRAAPDAITMPAPEEISFDGELLLSGILEDLMATPEDPRRVSKSISSRMLPSLGGSSSMAAGMTGNVVPNNASNTLLPFEPNETLDGLDFADLAVWNSGPSSDLGGFRHGLDPSQLGMKEDELAEMQVPTSVQMVKRPEAKRPRTRRSHPAVFDGETVLGREELLLREDEGLLPPINNPWGLKLTQLLLQLAPDPAGRPSLPKRPRKDWAVVEQGRGLESGIFDWDPYEEPPPPAMPETPQEHGAALVPGMIASSSMGPGRMSLNRSLSLPGGADRSSPLHTPTRDDGTSWEVPSEVGLRRDSLDLYGTIVGHLDRQRPTTGPDDNSGPGRERPMTIGIKTLVGPNGRRLEMAKCFHRLLDLARTGSIRVYQSRPYGDIQIGLPLAATH